MKEIQPRWSAPPLPTYNKTISFPFFPFQTTHSLTAIFHLLPLPPVLPTMVFNYFPIKFNTSEQLEEFYCDWKVNGTEVDQWLPICPFPYLPEGAGADGEKGWGDITDVDDCSITYADQMGMSAYQVKCMVYGLLNVVALLVNIRWLMLFKEKRMASKTHKVSSNETLCFINLLITFIHLVICVDMDGHAGRIPVSNN